MTIMAASSREGKTLRDVVFAAGAAAREAAAQYGEDKVINATVGCYAGEDEKLACLPVVEQLYRSLPMSDFITYAPPMGLEGYRKAVIDETFESCRPDGYVDAVATSGGTGAIHIAIANYSEVGDTVLTTDWRWNIYDCLCQEIGRNLHTFSMMDDQGHFNTVAFSAAVSNILSRQDSLLIILNTPANNPTGFALSDAEWADVLEICRLHEKNGKRISILVDIAYIAYAGEKNRVRSFMTQFAGLPEHIFTMFAFSMSKGYTLYGQRAGALVGLSSSKAVIEEFANLGKYSARTSWSNINRAAMTLLTRIRSDRDLMAQLDLERLAFAKNLRRRADIFTYEADRCGLSYVPYKGGFFISIPTQKSAAVCQALEDDLVFAAPLAQGVRLGVCSIPGIKMQGLATIVKKALDRVEGRTDLLVSGK